MQLTSACFATQNTVVKPSPLFVAFPDEHSIMFTSTHMHFRIMFTSTSPGLNQ